MILIVISTFAFVHIIELDKVIGVIVIGIVWFISGTHLSKHIPTLMPDWPKKKRFTGEIIFSQNFISIRSKEEESKDISKIKEIVFFYRSFRGDESNGNGLVFIKMENDETLFFKFNIPSKWSFEDFQILLTHYKNVIPYFREYEPYEIDFIMKKDLSEKIQYQ